METTKMTIVSLITVLTLMSCTRQEKTDLSKLNLNEPIETLINFNDKKTIGIETVEYPFCLLVEIDSSSKYSFDGIDLKEQKVIFQINSEQLKTDKHIKYGGGHVDIQSFKNEQELNDILKSYQAENKIYGFRIKMNTENLKTDILKKLESKYGKGTKNSHTGNGLYWNVVDESKYIFYAPDYDRLIVLNNTGLSKTCYWDGMNGLIDFGGCDYEEYMQDLLKNSTKTEKAEDIKNKPTLKIGKDWNLNDLVLGKADESDFIKSALNQNFEKMISLSDGNERQIMYKNDISDFYVYFTCNGDEMENQQNNILKGYSIIDFDKVDIQFANGLKANATKEQVLKLIDKNQIEDFDGLKFSNYIEIKNKDYKITLLFGDKDLFNSMYVIKKD